MALERRLGRQDSLLAALDVLLIGRRETAVSVEGNGIFLRHMYAALRLELPAAVGPDQRDRNDLLIVSDMFQVRERRVELGHIEVGVIADFAKPVVPVLLRRADEVVFIVLAEQIVGVLMLLRIIYDALDLNSHFKLFQLVSRRGFGRGLGLAAFDFNVSINAVRAANQVPRAILPPPFDVGFLVWLRIGVGFVDILIEPRNVLRFVQFDGIDVCSIDIIHAAVCVCTGQDAIVLRVRIMLGRPLDALHTNFGLLFFKVRLRVAGLVRGHFMRGFDPRVRCRFHPRLTIFIIGEVERDGQRGLGVLYLPDQIAGLLHEPCRPDSHWADISARAIAYDLADRMLCVGRVSERILYHIMRSGCRNADNIYNNAGHVVFRGLGGLVDGRGLRLPDGVEIGGRGGCCNRIARLDGGLCCVRIPSPAEEGVALSARLIAGNGERHRAGTALQRHRFGVRHVGDGIRRVLVVGQGVLGLFFFTGYGDGEGRGFLPPIAVSFILDQASTSVAITNFASMVIVIIECQLHCRCAGLCRSKVERQARKVLIFVIAIPAGNGPAEILQDSRVAELDCRRACRIVVGNKFG